MGSIVRPKEKLVHFVGPYKEPNKYYIDRYKNPTNGLSPCLDVRPVPQLGLQPTKVFQLNQGKGNGTNWVGKRVE